MERLVGVEGGECWVDESEVRRSFRRNLFHRGELCDFCISVIGGRLKEILIFFGKFIKISEKICNYIFL